MKFDILRSIKDSFVTKKYEPCPVFELCGDVCALNKVDLDKEGLGAYKSQVREKCGCPPPPSPPPAPKCPPPCDPCAGKYYFISYLKIFLNF